MISEIIINAFLVTFMLAIALFIINTRKLKSTSGKPIQDMAPGFKKK